MPPMPASNAPRRAPSGRRGRSRPVVRAGEGDDIRNVHAPDRRPDPSLGGQVAGGDDHDGPMIPPTANWPHSAGNRRRCAWRRGSSPRACRADEARTVATSTCRELAPVGRHRRPAADAAVLGRACRRGVRSAWRDRHVSIDCASGSTTAGSESSVRHVGSAARSKHSHDPSPNCTYAASVRGRPRGAGARAAGPTATRARRRVTISWSRQSNSQCAASRHAAAAPRRAGTASAGSPSHWAGTGTPIASHIVGIRSTFSVNASTTVPCASG